MDFYEKADLGIIKECSEFIEKSLNTIGDYLVFKCALQLSDILINSLLKSHKEFEDFIKEQTKLIEYLNDTQKDVFVIRFNNQKHRLFFRY